MLIIGSNDLRVLSLGKGLSFAVEARRGSLDMGTSTIEVSSKGGRDVEREGWRGNLAISNRSFGGCLRHFSRPSCTPRARLPLLSRLTGRMGVRDREETPIRGQVLRRRDAGTLVKM